MKLDADGLAIIPTVDDLGRRGLARASQTGKWEISPAGHAELGEAMAHNGRVLRDNPELRRRHEAAACVRPAR